MKKLHIMSAAVVLACAGSALADPAPNPNSNQSCVAQATLAYKGTNGSGNNGNGVAVREQAQSGTRGDQVSTLAQSCKGNTPD